jgi:hypothetical protein
MATLVTLVSFDDSDGEEPRGDLLLDANGDLFGTTESEAGNDGTVFVIEINNGTPTGYASTPNTLFSFSGTDGSLPLGNLITDGSGDLFGTTYGGGTNGLGTVFELVNNGGGDYALNTLVSFSGTGGANPGANPFGGLITDGNGDLFGTTYGGGTNGLGTAFELVNNGGGDYALNTLVSFSGTSGANPGANPFGSLITDGNGNLFGTTYGGGTGSGTVFELINNDGNYTPSTLVSFDGTDGSNPHGSLIADANGDLFGTTAQGGAGYGTVFELVNNDGNYTLNTLVSFDDTDGSNPQASLIADANGDLFGTTNGGGTNGLGTVFELVNNGGGDYTLNTLVSFSDTSGADPGANPFGSLIADGTGDLFGTTYGGGTNDDGTAFEVTDSGFQPPCFCHGTLIRTEAGDVPVETLKISEEVMTTSGVARPIKWIGRRSYLGRFVMGRKDILPICIKAGALDDNVPKRDLWISPNHAMYLDGVLIEAKDLVNGVSVVQAESVKQVEYFHIELESHDVIIAEGALSESFIDDDSRGMFHNAHEYRVMYPKDAATAIARYCAPRLDEGYELDTIRRRIALRAGLTSNEETTPRALRGYVDRVTPHVIEGWAQNVDHPEAPVCLDIYAGGRLIGQVLANRNREDLKRAGMGRGRHAFAFTPPAGLVFAPNAIDVRRSLDGEVLPRSAEAKRIRTSIAA